MAIQPCRECGEDVSTEAETCPSCGVRFPTQESGVREIRVWIGSLILTGFLVWWIFGCTSVNAFQRPAADRYVALPSDSVRVFPADSVPDCHEVLAELEGSGTVFNSREGLEDAMRRKAAEVGANGVVLGGYDTASWGMEAKSGRALAIRYGPEVCDG